MLRAVKPGNIRIYLPICLLFAIVLTETLPSLRAQAPNSPVGNHLVGTVLGETRSASLGDARLDARLVNTRDVAFLPGGDMLIGDMLIADQGQNRVLRVGVDGLLRTYAGNGKAEVTGDGGAAVDAGIHQPGRIATDGQGNVYIAHRTATGWAGFIRVVDATGKIRTLAGTGEPGCPVIGELANNSPLPEVEALAASGDAVYFSSNGCTAVYRIDSDGRIGFVVSSGPENPGGDTTFGAGAKTLPANRVAVAAVADLAVDAAGNLLVASSTHRYVYLVTPAGVAILIAGNGYTANSRQGEATSISFPSLSSIAPLPDGGVAIAQRSSYPTSTNRIELGVVDRNGEYRILYTGDGAEGKPTGQFGANYLIPMAVRASPDGTLYLIATPSGAVLRVNANGSTQSWVGQLQPENLVTPSDTDPKLQVSYMSNLVSDPSANLYFGALQKIYRLSPEGALAPIAGSGDSVIGADGDAPLSIGIGSVNELQRDAAGNLYWRSSDSRIRRLTPGNVIETVLGLGVTTPTAELPDVQAAMQRLRQWAVAANGEIYFLTVQADANRIWKLSSDGSVVRLAGTLGAATGDLDGATARDAGLRNLSSLGITPSGDVFFANSFQSDGGIYRIDSQGVMRKVALNPSASASVVDGAATVTAPSYPGNVFLPQAADKLLLSVGLPRALAAYVPGGAVTVWRDGNSGMPFNDGGLLKDDQFVDTSGLTTMPDGGLAWTELRGGMFAIRRSFPVSPGCTYSTSASDLPVSGGNSLSQITLTTQADCPWTLGASANWVEILSKRNGKGTVSVNLRTLANPSPSERVAIVRIAGKEVLVRQAPSTLPDVFVVSPASANIPPTGGSVEVTISASPGLPWQVALPGIGVGIQGPSAGSGSGSFVLGLDALPANQSERTAIVTINDKTVTLRQVALPSPVTVTVNSVPAGSKATIDLVERTLPYVTQWIPGSYHVLQAAAFAKVNDSTLIQFQTFGTTNPNAEQIFITPPTPTTLVAQYRRLHLLRARPLVQTLPSTIMPLTNFDGIPVPQEFAAPVLEAGAFAKWYPEGAMVDLFAPEEVGVRFANFTGGLTTTENPTSVQMSAPATITSNYTSDISQQASFIIGGKPNWWFYGDSRQANAAQVTVEPSTADPQTEPRRFVAYQDSIDSPAWLTLRSSNSLPPMTLEAGVDAAKAAGLAMSDIGGSHQAMVYLHRPGTRTASFPVSASIGSAPANDLPWISALTDAGGFRQSVGEGSQASLDVAPGMIVTVFGLRFGTQTLDAKTVPLPTVLGGVSVEAQMDGTGTWAPMPLFFVSPNQINFQVSPTVPGSGAGNGIHFRVRTGAATVSESWAARVRSRSVSLFSADSSGSGAPAGFFVRVLPDQTQERGDLYQCANRICIVPTTAFRDAGNDVFLELFGTGFRDAGLPDRLRVYIGGRAAEVAFAGPHPVYVGLDQLNVKVPRDITKGSSLDLYVWVRNGDGPWVASNRLTVRFQ